MKNAMGGKCLVNWKRICAPKEVGGLGIKDLKAYSRSLRLRWPWFAWTSPNRPWCGSETPCGPDDLQLFSACTTITLGDGAVTNFWSDRWLAGTAAKDSFPELFKLAFRKNLSVKEALHNGRWMRGLHRINSTELLMQFLSLWNLLSNIQLSDRADGIRWNLTADGQYTASSAYAVQFLGRIHSPVLNQVWRLKIEPKVRFFIWLLLQNRLWTSDRLSARGWPNNSVCPLCDQELECTSHLFLTCPFAKEVWMRTARTFQPASRAALSKVSIVGWWSKLCRMDKTSAAYTVWHIWKERNGRIFQQHAVSALQTSRFIRESTDLLLEAREM